MSDLEKFKQNFEKVIKRLEDEVKELSKKYKKMHYDQKLIGYDIQALDSRLIRVEKLNNLNDNNLDININKNVININNENNIGYNKEGELFRKQVSSRETDKKNIYKMNEDISGQRFNSSRANYLEENRKKERKRKSPNKNKKGKNNFIFRNDENINDNLINYINIKKDNNIDNDSNLDNINNIINKNKDDNFDIMSFGKNALENSNNLNNSMITTTSAKISEFSFNPNKFNNNINNSGQSRIKENEILIDINKNQNMMNKSFNNTNKFQINTNIENILNTEIIKSLDEIQLILTSLPTYNKFDSSLPNFQSIFQSSLDGDSAQTFHKFCDGEPNIIILVETKKGNRFGGYTKIGFSSVGGKKFDDSFFLFSLTQKRIYKIKKKYKYIICDQYAGPCFGDKENQILKISDNYLEEKSYFNKSKEFYFEKDQDKDFLINIEPEFIVNKLEIIKILI